MNKKTIKDFLQKNSTSLAVPLMMIVIGLFFIAFPGGALNLTVKVIGVIFVVVGLVLSGTLIAAYSSVTMVIAIITILLGIICIALPGSVAAFVIKLIGLIIVINCALRIHDAYQIKGISDNFVLYIINDLITLVLGILLLVMPMRSAKVFVIIVGVLMVALGVSNIITAVRIYKDGKYIDDGTDVVWEE
ncbi:MAG: DUF308 domain-containing protein [Eubacterium sp.]|nr:DUF308 domain-containing protein [Eubacterium sp.]